MNKFNLGSLTKNGYIAVYLDKEGKQKIIPNAKSRKQKWKAQQDADDYMLKHEVQTYVSEIIY